MEDALGVNLKAMKEDIKRIVTVYLQEIEDERAAKEAEEAEAEEEEEEEEEEDDDDDIGVINIRYSRSGHGEAAHESLHDGDDEEDNDEPGGAFLTSRTHRSLRRRYCCEQCTPQ